MPSPNDTKKPHEKIVVDTNILIAAILKNGPTRDLIIMGNQEIFASEQSIQEINNHQQELCKRKSIQPTEFETIVNLLHQYIQFLPLKDSEPYFNIVTQSLPKTHYDDWPFIALALHLKCPLWSNDAALKNQKVVRVYTTKELIQPKEIPNHSNH